MVAPQNCRMSSSVTTLPISTPPVGIQKFVIRRGRKAKGQVMTSSSLGIPGVSPAVPDTLSSISTTTS